MGILKCKKQLGGTDTSGVAKGGAQGAGAPPLSWTQAYVNIKLLADFYLPWQRGESKKMKVQSSNVGGVITFWGMRISIVNSRVQS